MSYLLFVYIDTVHLTVCVSVCVSWCSTAFRRLARMPILAAVTDTFASIGPGFFDCLFELMGHYRAAYEVRSLPARRVANGVL